MNTFIIITNGSIFNDTRYEIIFFRRPNINLLKRNIERPIRSCFEIIFKKQYILCQGKNENLMRVNHSGDESEES